jgi:carboxyl-terminal processing protease
MSRFPLLIFCLVLVSFNVAGQAVCVRARTVFDMISAAHVQPRQLNDSFSEDVFSMFFKTLDDESELFISQDTSTLKAYRYKLDDKNQATCDFVEKVIILYKQRAGRYVEFIDSLLSKPLNLSKVEYTLSAFEIDPPMCATTAELNDRLLKNYKLGVLTSMYWQAGFDTMNILDNNAFLGFEAKQGKSAIRPSLPQAASIEHSLQRTISR